MADKVQSSQRAGLGQQRGIEERGSTQLFLALLQTQSYRIMLANLKPGFLWFRKEVDAMVSVSHPSYDLVNV